MALIGAEPIGWAEMAGPLSEVAAGIVLEELCLDRLLGHEMQMAGLTLETGAADAERALLIESLVEGAGVKPDQGEELLRKVRESRGLGETRFRGLLHRNAMLRRLVRDEVTITPEDVQRAFDIRYGPRFKTRLIVTPTEKEAAAALARLRGGNGQPGEPFNEVAAEMSVDSSRERGGLIGAVSPADPSYPAAVRTALENLRPGEISPAIALDKGYAIVRLDEIVPAAGASVETTRSSLEREIRAVRERALMDRLATRLLKGASVTVLDPAMEWSWRSRTRQDGQ